MALIDVRISFPFNIVEQMDRISSNFVYALIMTRHRLRLLPVIFRKFAAELWPLIEIELEFYAQLAFTSCKAPLRRGLSQIL